MNNSIINFFLIMSLGYPYAPFGSDRFFLHIQCTLINNIKFEKCRTTSFANMFVPMTSSNWNSLPAFIFPSTYNLQTFKNPGSQTPTPPPSHLINFPFSSVMQGSFEIHRGCIILVRPFLHSISSKKKKI